MLWAMLPEIKAMMMMMMMMMMIMIAVNESWVGNGRTGHAITE